jgi:uncharacterized protein
VRRHSKNWSIDWNHCQAQRCIIIFVNTRNLTILVALGIASSNAIADEPLARRAALGIQFAALTDADKDATKLIKGQGIKIVRVMPGLSGESANFQAGDILFKVDGKPVASTAAISPAMHGKREGATMNFEVLRGSNVVKLSTKLIGKPKQKEDGFKVEYDQVTSLGKRIRVIYTYPEGKGPFPTVFMIGGIGAYSADGEYPAVAYGNILGPIAKSGYAVVRVEKPGQGDSEGPIYTDLLFDVEMDAYLQALRHTKTKSFVDKNRIAIFGHSMGGSFGPLIATEEPVRGVAVCGTLTKTWLEYVLENTRRQSVLGGGKPEDVEAEMSTLTAVNHYVFNEGLMPKEVIKRHPELKEAVMANFPDMKTYSGVGIPFFQQLAKKKLMGAWAKSSCKVLSLWGENDFISGEWDHDYLASSLNKVKAGRAQYIKIPNSDHGFNTTSSQLDSMMKWGRPGAVFNPNIIDILKKWLQEVL